MNLIELSLHDFLGELGSSSPAPGGGSAAALAGALAAALCRMVSALTVGKEKLKSAWTDLDKVGREAATLEDRLRGLVDEDTLAFRSVLEARKLPRETDQERQSREHTLQEAILQSAKTPLSTLCALRSLSALALCAADRGNPACITDAGCASQLIRAGALGAAYNVRVNLPSIHDPVAREELKARTNKLLQEVLDDTQRTENIVEARLALLQAGV